MSPFLSQLRWHSPGRRWPNSALPATESGLSPRSVSIPCGTTGFNYGCRNASTRAVVRYVAVLPPHPNYCPLDMRRERQIQTGLGGARWWGSGRRIPILSAVEDRVSLPGDSSTLRFQKMLVVVVSLFGSVTTVFNAMPFFAGFLDAMAWTYMASAVVLFLGGAAILLRPSLYVPATFVILLNVLVIATATQVLSGGYTSGILAMPWTLLAALGAVLTLSGRLALVQLGLFVVAAVVVAMLEPLSRRIAPFIAPGIMLRYNVSSLITLGLIAVAPSLYLLRQVERFRHQADSLLLNVLPVAVADRLKAGETPIADGYENVTVLFADIAGFTELSAKATPEEIVGLINEVFSEFDELAKKHGVEKVKTTGDAYMAAVGLTETGDDPEAIIEFGLDLLETVKGKTWPNGEPVRFRVGVHTGPVVAGVIGHDRFIYDLWGDAVNMAARMESTGPVGGIQVTEEVRERVGGRYRFAQRHEFPVKGKGMTVTYTLMTESTEPLPPELTGAELVEAPSPLV